MKIIIVGAGAVGSIVAQKLSAENQVTMTVRPVGDENAEPTVYTAKTSEALEGQALAYFKAIKFGTPFHQAMVILFVCSTAPVV